MGFTVSWVRFVIEVFVSSLWTLFDVHSIVQYPRASEEREPLSSHHGTVAALSTGLLVNTNLETSSPDTYRPPPAPLPYDVNLGRPQTPPSNQETCGNKNDAPVHTANTGTVDETISGNDILETLDELLKKSDYKVEKDTELASSMEIEVELEKSGELKKSSEPLVFVGEECPTCLEGIEIVELTIFILYCCPNSKGFVWIRTFGGKWRCKRFLFSPIQADPCCCAVFPSLFLEF